MGREVDVGRGVDGEESRQIGRRVDSGRRVAMEEAGEEGEWAREGGRRGEDTYTQTAALSYWDPSTLHCICVSGNSTCKDSPWGN